MSQGAACIFIQWTSFKILFLSSQVRNKEQHSCPQGRVFLFALFLSQIIKKNSSYRAIFKTTTYSYASQHIPTLSSLLWQVFNWAKTLFLLRCKFRKTRSLLPGAWLAGDIKATPVLGMAMWKCRDSSGNTPMVTNCKTCPSRLLPEDYSTDMGWEVCV